jgi:DNA-binding LacI/PurR family transcriptional regulator
MREVAEKAGVSRYTVSKVLNNDKSVKKKTAEQVLKACNELAYFPNQNAVSLVKGKSTTIGVIVYQINNPFYSELVTATEEAALNNGYHVIFQSSYGNPQREADIIKRLCSLKVCGIIITPLPTDESRELLKQVEKNIPVVYVDRYYEKKSNYIINDNYDSAGKVTRHLIEEGGNPAYLGSARSLEDKHVFERQRGYLETMQKNKLTPELIPTSCKGKVFKGKDEDSEEFGYIMTGEWLKNKPENNAMLCATDAIALGAMRAIAEAKLIIGKDFIIAGHDDYHFSRYLNPSLTTIRQPKNKIADNAVEMIINNKTGKHRQLKLKSKLMIRDSSSFSNQDS